MTIIRRALILALSAVALALAAGTVAAADVIATSDDLERLRSDIAMNAQGRNVAAFALPVDKGFAVFARSRSRAGGPWGTRVRLSTVFDEPPDDIRVAMDERGRAIVTWRRPGGPASASDLGYAIRLTAAGPWELHARSGIARGVGASSVLAFGGGRATLAWGELSAVGWRVRRATLDLAAGTPRSWAVGAPRALGAPALAVNPRGDVAAIGLATDPTTGPYSGAVVATTHAADAAGWEDPVTLSPAGREATIAIADGGPLVAAWREAAPATGIVVATRVRLAEGWGPPEALARSGFAPVVAVGPTGQALVAYSVNLDTLDPPDPDFVFPPGGSLTYPLGNIMRAHRRAPTGVWGAEETVFAFYDGMRETYREARNVRAAVDALGTTLLAWSSTDSGLGAPWATAAPAAAPFPPATKYGRVDGIEQAALAPSGRGEAAVGWTLRSDRVPAASCATPPQSPPPANADTITLSLTQLIINQRIYSAALRRADALEGWLRARIATRDLCGGGIGATALGAGVEVVPAPGPRTVPVATPRSLTIRPAADKDGVVFTLSAAQLRINQRIGQAAIRRLNGVRSRLLDGISGDELRRATITGANLTP
jgi:hypothetical protein